MEGRFRLTKPTLETNFRIDFDWWKSHDRDWMVYMRSFLCSHHSEVLQNIQDDEKIDHVDMETAEVKTVEAIEYILLNHCSKQDDFVSQSGAMVDSVFRIFLANGNKPLNCGELSVIIQKPADLILRTFTSSQVYKGIRPV